MHLRQVTDKKQFNQMMRSAIEAVVEGAAKW